MARILIVDDSMIMRRNLRTMLEREGHEVVAEASNGREAIEEYERAKPDIVVMDMNMPIMDGIEATRSIMEKHEDARIIMVSPVDRKDRIITSLQAGSSQFIAKPIVERDLLRIIDDLFRSNRFKELRMTLGSDSEAVDRMYSEIRNASPERRIDDTTQPVSFEGMESEEDISKVIERLKLALSELQNVQDVIIGNEKSNVLAGMIAGMAHEINTPVGICVTGISYLSERTKEISEKYAKGEMKRSDFESYLETSRITMESALLNLAKASDLIRSLKLISVDQTSDEKRSFNIKDYLGEIMLSLRPELKRREHSIDISCDDDLSVYSFPGALYQIINNLVINTLRHGYTKDERAVININVTRSGGNLIIEYHDAGRGIRKEDLGRIFEPFFTTTRDEGGTGLGTSIIHNLVTKKLKGTIKVESEEGMGVVFTIIVPCDENEKSQG